MATVTTPTTPTAWSPDQTAFVPQDQIPEAAFLQTCTVVGVVEGDQPAARVPFVSDDGTAGFVAEGAEIPEPGSEFAEAVISTHKVATLGKYSRETLAQPNAAAMIADSLSRSVINSADSAYLGNGADPAGLLNSGISDGGAVGADLDGMIDAVAAIEGDGGRATHIVAAPDSWASLAKIKATADSNASLIGAGTQAAERMILSLPVVTTRAMPSGQLLIMDRAAVVGAQSQLRLARSEEQYFSSDSVGVRLTWRLGWAVMRPGRVVKLSTTTEPAG